MALLMNDAVYPRWRGEHIVDRMCCDSENGLSPLARGTLSDKCHRVRRVRFIPAGAGNTIKPNFATMCASVYPRWRGEHVKYRAIGIIHRGLSPLARGTPV